MSINDEKVRYLERLFDQEEDRRKTIDGKLTSLVGQSGIVFTVSSLILPFLYNKADSINSCLLIFISVFYFLIFALFIASILFASQIFNISSYNYMIGGPDIVKTNDDEDKMKKEEIQDLQESIEHNVKLNDKKGSILILSGKFFAAGLSLISIIIILSFIGIYTSKSKSDEVKIVNQISLEKIENEAKVTNQHLSFFENVIKYHFSINIEHSDSLKIKNK